MEQEFMISSGLKVFYGIVAIFLGGFSILLFLIAINVNGIAYVDLIPLCLLFFAFWMGMNLIKSKITITDFSIVRIRAFSREEILIADIKGCRIGQKVIWVVPSSASSKKITLNNYIDYRGCEDILKWAQGFPDLDAIDLKEEKARVFNDEMFGSNIAERENRLQSAKITAIAYNIIGGLVEFVIIFSSKRTDPLYLILAYPLLGIILMIFSGGMIRFFGNRKRSVFAFIAPGFFFSAFMMAAVSGVSYDLLFYQHFWLPFFIISVAISLPIFFFGRNKSAGFEKAQIFGLIFIAMIYSAGFTIQVNCFFDKSAPQEYSTTVNDKHFTTGKGAAHYLTLAPWGQVKEAKDVTVGRSLYYEVNPGDSVRVYQKNGVLSIPWFYIDK